MKILLTGATGFVGQHIFKAIDKKFATVVLGRKRSNDYLGEFIEYDLKNTPDEGLNLQGIDVVIHSAARAHIMHDASLDPQAEYLLVNTEATLTLARSAAESGVKRFIFISSIKVNGESTSGRMPFTSSDQPCTSDHYGQSKLEAENRLKDLAAKTGLEVVIIRPTLVYGLGVKANFASLMKLISKGMPLPFGCITKNKRSLVSVDNLVDLIITCIDHPKAANQVFLVSDDHDVSTSEMVSELAIALGKPTWQLPVPIWCYKLFGKLFGKSDIVDRLTGSLQVDISHTKETLGWKPPQILQEGFKQTAQAFLQANNK
ncbi:UDP-glucose 4-epimerase family protein [Vibrio cholerae]|uniref:UDP-glucose 4-epimerase family protein n=1 Tax=Vibrio cholerae TaxID=666 RepID=UPI000F3E8062|nr:SDR family oxidoreductase [Vibrio cholerae]EGQ8189891.1 SDR family oxidoreductase [Vibrio cholerae]EGR0357783.1 SDR family oxidoreductase [Vibrio cholerae]EJL6271589.1 SDR family oxidoreductase [Vibrio cholerae]EJL6278980.1 SDR family oxidoreductase [Vibrio cholerae]EJL6583026.1 SDR family oxidoreductase [Vibrio cholerae]